jgi:hypothetical protein
MQLAFKHDGANRLRRAMQALGTNAFLNLYVLYSCFEFSKLLRNITRETLMEDNLWLKEYT